MRIEEFSALAGVEVESLRRRVRRGHAPASEGDGLWADDVVWAWLVRSDLQPMGAVPLANLKAVLDELELAAGFELTDIGVRDEGIVLRYGHLVRSDIAFALIYPAIDTYGSIPSELNPALHDHVAGMGCMAAALVQNQVTRRGEFDVLCVTVASATAPGPQFGATLGDVAELVGSPIPYWPADLRHLLPVVSPHNRSMVGQAPVSAIAGSRRVAVEDQALAVFADTMDRLGDDPHRDLAMAVREFALDRAQARYTSYLDEMTRYVEPHTAQGGYLAEDRYLWPVVLAVEPRQPTISYATLRATFADLGWRVPVGTQPECLAASMLLNRIVNHDISYRSFDESTATAAQRDFLDRTVSVDTAEVTLAHLGHTQWRFTTAIDGGRFLTDPLSGAVGHQDCDGIVRYSVPTSFPDIDVAAFDFQVADEPFAWSRDNVAVPFPAINSSGFSLGYSGNGPEATTAAIQRFLHLDGSNSLWLSAGWPLYRRGYAKQYTADFLRGYFTQDRADMADHAGAS